MNSTCTWGANTGMEHSTKPGWADELKATSLPPALVTLALSAFGLSSKWLSSHFDLSDLAIQQVLREAIGHGREVLPRRRGGDELDAIGLRDLERLVMWTSTPMAHQLLRFREEHTPIYVLNAEGESPIYEEEDLPHQKIVMDDAATLWFDQVRRLFLRPTKQTELLILLPRPTPELGKRNWDVHSSMLSSETPEHAFRVLAGLSVLGLTHRASGHRTRLLPDLVVRCPAIGQHFAVAGIGLKEQMIGDDQKAQLKSLPKGAILRRPESGLPGAGSVEMQAWAIDYSSEWRAQPNRLADLSIRDRAQDVDEMADALLWLMCQTSGVCVHLSLEQRARYADENDVRIITPQPWLAFLQQGHGAKRNQGEPFEPYRQRDVPGMPLLWVDEPTRYEKLKGTAKRAYVRKPPDQKKKKQSTKNAVDDTARRQK